MTNKLHMQATPGIAICGYLWVNTVKDEKIVTCKLCNKEMKK